MIVNCNLLNTGSGPLDVKINVEEGTAQTNLLSLCSKCFDLLLV